MNKEKVDRLRDRGHRKGINSPDEQMMRMEKENSVEIRLRR